MAFLQTSLVLLATAYLATHAYAQLECTVPPLQCCPADLPPCPPLPFTRFPPRPMTLPTRTITVLTTTYVTATETPTTSPTDETEAPTATGTQTSYSMTYSSQTTYSTVLSTVVPCPATSTEAVTRPSWVPKSQSVAKTNQCTPHHVGHQICYNATSFLMCHSDETWTAPMACPAGTTCTTYPGDPRYILCDYASQSMDVPASPLFFRDYRERKKRAKEIRRQLKYPYPMPGGGFRP